MLYIASALPPTAVIDSRLIEGFSDSPSSLLVAKPDRIELHNVTETGLELCGSLDVWGNVVAIEKVQLKGSRPHLLVLLAPPNALALLLTYSTSAPHLIITSSLPLSPPTPSLRQAEFFSSVIVHDRTAIASLWIGVLSYIELALEGDKASKRRRSSALPIEPELGEKKVVLKETSYINIREHNLLHLSFLSTPSTAGPIVSFLYLSPTDTLCVQLRVLGITSRAFTDASAAINVVYPSQVQDEDDKPFSAIPYSCPAARRVVPLPPIDGLDASFLVIGDEFSVLYALTPSIGSPKARRTSIASSTTSPRASNTRRSPQAEMSGPAKRYRTSIGSASSGEKWSVTPVFRARQGYGTVLASAVLHSSANYAAVMIGDECGRLTVLSFSVGETRRVELEKIDFGMISPPSTLIPLGGNILFVGSAAGDSQIVQLGSSSSKRKGKAVASDAVEDNWTVHVSTADGTSNILQRWTNLAPVKDFTVVQDESGSLSHLVVASGAATANSLRIVRSGVGMEQVLNVDGIEGVQQMWSIPGKIIISTATDTSIIQLDPPQVLEICPEIETSPLLAAGLAGKTLITVTSESVTAWKDVVDGTKAAAWVAPGVITAAKVQGKYIAVSTKGKVTVLSFHRQLNNVATLDAPEVASLDVLEDPAVLVIATWTNEILAYSIKDLGSSSLPLKIVEDAYAVSLLLQRAPLRLLAGLGNGMLITLDLAIDSGIKNMGRKASKLGSRPLRLFPISEWQGDERIAAVGLSERMSVIFETKGRIDFSSVGQRDVLAAAGTRINNDQALVLATPTGLSICKVNSLKKLSVQTLDMQERSASKLAYIPNAIVAGGVVRSVDSHTGEIVQKSFLEKRDATTLQLHHEIPLNTREIVTALKPVTLGGRTMLAVGTAVFTREADYEDWAMDEHNRIDALEGRVLLVDTREKLSILTLVKTIGPVHDVAAISGYLAIAAASKVSINRFDPAAMTLIETGSFSSTFIAQHLQVVPAVINNPDERLIVGDGMRSVTVLDVDESTGHVYGDQRDMATHSVQALGGVKDVGEGAIISDGHSNLLTFRLRDTIETAASFGLHEPIVRFKKASLAPPASAADHIAPDLLFFTPDGRLGIVGELTPGAAIVLGELQRNMDKYVPGPGGQEWKVWRRGGSEVVKRETAGFVDGDFVQSLLGSEIVNGELVEKALRGTHSHERVHGLDARGRKYEAGKGDVIRVLESVAGVH